MAVYMQVCGREHGGLDHNVAPHTFEPFLSDVFSHRFESTSPDRFRALFTSFIFFDQFVFGGTTPSLHLACTT
jgi:hypothetical protein